MYRWLVMVIAVSSCGRLSFDARDSGIDVDGGDAGTSPGGVYYADDGVLYRIDVTSGVRTVVTSTLGYPNGLTFDAPRSTLYISEDDRNEIIACDVEACVPRLIYAAGERVEGIGVDDASGSIYFAAKQSDEVWAVGLDGQSPRMVLAGVQAVDGVVFDPISDRIYVTSAAAAGFVARARPDGSGYETIIPGLALVEGIALDGQGHIFFVDGTAVRRADLDGGNLVELVPGVDGGEGLALDLVNGHIYWTDSGQFSVWRANLDGTEAMEIQDGLGSPEDIAVGP